MKKWFAGVFALVCIALNGKAAVVENNVSNGGAGGTISLGQSFIWTSDFALEVISVTPWNGDYTVELKIFDGDTGSCNVGGEIYSQTGIVLSDDHFPALQEIILTTPVPLTNGNAYTFCFYPSVDVLGLAVDWDGHYAGGTRIVDGAADLSSDLKFVLDAPSHISGPVSVPLFGPLGSALLVSLFGFFGYRKLKQA